MIKQTIVCLSLAAASCATPGDIYASNVDATATSTKPIADVSQCLQLRLAEAPITTPDNKVSFPLKNGYGEVLGMLTLTPQTSGTLLELRKTPQMVFGGADWRKCV